MYISNTLNYSLLYRRIQQSFIFIVIMIFVSNNKPLKQFLMFNFSLKCYVDEFI